MVNSSKPYVKLVKVRVVDMKRLDALKTHARQPYWEIIRDLLNQRRNHGQARTVR